MSANGEEEDASGGSSRKAVLSLPEIPTSSDTEIYDRNGESSQILQEQTLREELLMFVGDRCCLGTEPARTWQFDSIISSVSYAANMETFVQIRRSIRSAEPFYGGQVDGSSKLGGQASPINMWNLPVHGHEPENFKNRELTLHVPHSDHIEVCDECQGQGGTRCKECEGGSKLDECRVCRGTGGHGEDELCSKCIGTGHTLCGACGSLGLIQCHGCSGTGSLLIKQYVVVSWITVVTQLIVHQDKACLVPDKIILQGQGSVVLESEDIVITDLTIEDDRVRHVSREILQQRNKNMPAGSRIMRERLIILDIPLTKSILSSQGKRFTFYVVGVKRNMYLQGYPSQCVRMFPFGCFPCHGCN